MIKLIICMACIVYIPTPKVIQGECVPIECPEDLKGHAELGQIPCYLSVLNTRHPTATGKCKNCNGDIVFINGNKWVHDTFPQVSGGYEDCASHIAKQVCKSSTLKTVAEPSK